MVGGRLIKAHCYRAIPPRGSIGGGPKEHGVKHFRVAHPPPPAKWNWRSGSYFPRKTHVLVPSRFHLAEGVSRQHLTKNGLDCASTRAATCAWRWSGGKSGWQVSLPTISALAKSSDLLMACQFGSYVEPPATLPLCHALGNDAIVAKPDNHGQPEASA